MWNEIQHFTACTRFQFSFWMKKGNAVIICSPSCHFKRVCRTQKKILWSTVFVHKMKVKTTWDPIDFYCMYKQHWHSSNYFQLFSTDERKLEKFQGWANDRTSIFWLNYPFNKLLRSDWNDLEKKTKFLNSSNFVHVFKRIHLSDVGQLQRNKTSYFSA